MDTALLPSLLIAFATAGFFARYTAFGGSLVTQLGNRQPEIDGLRGLCALSVALHHFAYLSHWKAGVWNLPIGSHVTEAVGKVGVAMFFMICAYLFWGRLDRIGAGGLTGWLRFLDNRVRRIVPMYVFAMTLAMLLLGLATRRFTDWQPWPALVENALRAFTFWFFPPERFNNSISARAALGVAWTLRYEWLFYASLPALFFLRVKRYWLISLVFFIVANELWAGIYWIEYFAYGCIAREVSQHPDARRLAKTPIAALVSIALVACTSYFANSKELALGLPVLAISIAFLLIAAGNDWFGLLRSSGARLAGACSYSIYLINVIVQAPLVQLLPGSATSWDVVQKVGVMTASTMAVIAASAVTYRFIELPFQRRAMPTRVSDGSEAIAGG